MDFREMGKFGGLFLGVFSVFKLWNEMNLFRIVIEKEEKI